MIWRRKRVTFNHTFHHLFHKFLSAGHPFFFMRNHALKLRSFVMQRNRTRKQTINELSHRKRHIDCDGVTKPDGATPSATEGDVTEIWAIRACCVRSSGLTNFLINVSSAGKETSHHRQRRRKFSYVSILLCLGDNLLNQTGQYIYNDGGRGAGSLTLREQRSSPSWQTKAKGKEDVFPKRMKSKEPLTQKDNDVKKNYDELHEQDGHRSQNIGAKYRIKEFPGDMRPLRSPPYLLSAKSCEFEKNEIGNMLWKKATDAAQTPWAAPIFLAPKKDCSARFWVDYPKLKAVMEGVLYPTLRMDEFFDSNKKGAVVLPLDANNGYRQVEVEAEHRDKSAFTSIKKLYGFLRKPFELQNARSASQSSINVALSRP